jgi:hypothetical protein
MRSWHAHNFFFKLTSRVTSGHRYGCPEAVGWWPDGLADHGIGRPRRFVREDTGKGKLIRRSPRLSDREIKRNMVADSRSGST